VLAARLSGAGMLKPAAGPLDAGILDDAVAEARSRFDDVGRVARRVRGNEWHLSAPSAQWVPQTPPGGRGARA
jgi:hypothetical protein